MPEQEFQRLITENLSDFHMHCDYSADAVGAIADYCRAALRKGLREVCFTTHYDVNPHIDVVDTYLVIEGRKHRTRPELLRPYIDEIQAAHDEFYPLGLSVKSGIEFGWFPGCEEHVLKVRDMFPLDYVLCGIHDVDDVCICSHRVEQNLGRVNPQALVEGYFREVVAAARTGLFDAIAHLTYYRRYGVDFYGPEINTMHEPYQDEVFAALRESDTAVEINTSGIRHGLDDHYPHAPFVNAAKKAGVRVDRLGSDAHRPEQVGYDFDSAAPLVAEHQPYYEE